MGSSLRPCRDGTGRVRPAHQGSWQMKTRQRSRGPHVLTHVFARLFARVLAHLVLRRTQSHQSSRRPCVTRESHRRSRALLKARMSKLFEFRERVILSIRRSPAATALGVWNTLPGPGRMGAVRKMGAGIRVGAKGDPDSRRTQAVGALSFAVSRSVCESGFGSESITRDFALTKGNAVTASSPRR
jgi:hypothetical protein